MPDPDGEPLSPLGLSAFVAAMETGTVAAAADALELTQSAATKRIQALERRLGVALFSRGRNGITPTEAGRLLYPEAQQALAALRHAASVVADADHAPAMHLAASHTIGGYLLPAWLSVFRAADASPRRVQVEVANSRDVLARVRDHKVDIGFIESLQSIDGLECQTILHDEIVVVVAATHRWAHRSAIAAQDLHGEPFLTRERGSGTRSVAVDALSAAGVHLDVAIEATSTQSLRRGVLADGFALLSRLAVDADVRAGTLRALPVTGVDLTRPLRAVRRRDPAFSPVAQRFWRFLRTQDVA